MKKSVKARVLALAVASVFLCGALTVAAVMGSPYETLKNAVLDALAYENVTVETQAVVTINGEFYDRQKTFSVYGDDSYLNYDFDKDGNPDGYFYRSKTLTINRSYVGADGTQWYDAYIHPDFDYYYPNSFVLTTEDRNSARVRFMELAVDALVGDLKNNITMSSNGGTRLIQGTLTESQVPELAKAGIDVLVEESSSREYYNEDDPFDIPIKSLTINYLHGEAEVDPQGNLLSLDFYAKATVVDILGETKVFEFDCEVRFSSIGATEAVCPVPGAKQLLTTDYMKAKCGSGFGTVYFTLNEDGSINAGSVTTTYPGETERTYK